jgi:hypothetical protein
MSHLLEIADDARALDKLLDECDGDLTGMEQVIDGWLHENSENLKEKADDYLALISEKMRMYAARQGEAERLNRLALTDKNCADRLKARLMFALTEMCITKLETDRYKVTVAKNGGKQKLDIHVPVEELPAYYKKALPLVADKEAIREALEAGKKVPGAVLQERGTSLRIR